MSAEDHEERPPVPTDQGNNSAAAKSTLFSTVGSQVEGLDGTGDEIETQPVDEIESLCMQCQENVGGLPLFDYLC